MSATQLAASPETVAPLGRVLVVDHVDSFVYNLVQLLGGLGAEVRVVRHDRCSLAQALDWQPEAVVLSPGPGSPADQRLTGPLLAALASEPRPRPLLGVCLGHQAIAAHLGGRVVRARRPLHGVATPLRHGGGGPFAGLPSPLQVARYHSLVVDPAALPEAIEPLAWSDEEELMAFAVRGLPWVGVQFHPESFLSEHGAALVWQALRPGGGHE